MGRLKQFLHCFVSRSNYTFFPHGLRQVIIKTIILAEELAAPREALQWIFGVYDYTVIVWAANETQQPIRLLRIVNQVFSASTWILSAFLDRILVLEYSPTIFADEMEKAGLKIISQEVRWGDIWSECEPLS